MNDITENLDLNEEFEKLMTVSNTTAVAQAWFAQYNACLDLSLRFSEGKALVLQQNDGSYVGLNSDGTGFRLVLNKENSFNSPS